MIIAVKRNKIQASSMQNKDEGLQKFEGKKRRASLPGEKPVTGASSAINKTPISYVCPPAA
jgi:hypothetical protein